MQFWNPGTICVEVERLPGRYLNCSRIVRICTGLHELCNLFLVPIILIPFLPLGLQWDCAWICDCDGVACGDGSQNWLWNCSSVILDDDAIPAQFADPLLLDWTVFRNPLDCLSISPVVGLCISQDFDTILSISLQSFVVLQPNCDPV